MPEMTAMPILPSATPPASSSSPSSSLVARTDKASTSTQAVNTANSSTEPGTAPNDNAGSADTFARVLQLQLEKTTAKPLPDVALVIDTNAKPLADVAVVIDFSVKPLPDATVVVDANVKPLPDAAVVIDSNVKILPLPVATLMPALKEAIVSSKSADEVSQEKPDDGLASLSPYLLSLVTNPGVKLEANSPNLTVTDNKPAAASEGEGTLPLAVTTPLFVQAQLADTKDAPSTNLAEMSQTAATKTAEFAAGLGALAEAAPAHAGMSESAGSETSFENLLVAAQALNSSHSAGVRSPSHTTTSLPVQTPVGARGWDGEVSDKLVWMVGRQEQRAELVLNPPQLGRVEVTLSMSGGQTTAQFVSANPAVRDALEAAMPRLREILAEAGVNLGQAQVGADAGSNQTANQSTNNQENWDNSRRGTNKFDLANGMDTQRPIGTTQWLRQSNNLVDVFA